MLIIEGELYYSILIRILSKFCNILITIYIGYPIKLPKRKLKVNWVKTKKKMYYFVKFLIVIK